jgi:hypothetical protein
MVEGSTVVPVTAKELALVQTALRMAELAMQGEPIHKVLYEGGNLMREKGFKLERAPWSVALITRVGEMDLPEDQEQDRMWTPPEQSPRVEGPAVTQQQAPGEVSDSKPEQITPKEEKVPQEAVNAKEPEAAGEGAVTVDESAVRIRVRDDT